jgi:hypothetical protein
VVKRPTLPPPSVTTMGPIRRFDAVAVNLVSARGHLRPIALAPFMIRWGPDVSSDVLRRSARCTQCGQKSAI